MTKRRSFSRAFKAKVVERMKTCENISALAAELKILRKTLYEWKAGLEGRPTRGRPAKRRAAPAPTSPQADQIAHWKEIASQLALENHFFKQALQQTEGLRSPSDVATKGPSGKSSGLRAKRKAD
jgi:transposase-like protein